MDDESFFDLEPEADGPGLWDDLPEMEQSWDANAAPAAQIATAESDFEWNPQDFSELGPGAGVETEVEPAATFEPQAVAEPFLGLPAVDEPEQDQPELHLPVMEQPVMEQPVMEQTGAEQAQGEWADFDEHTSQPSAWTLAAQPEPVTWSSAFALDTSTLDTSALDTPALDATPLSTSYFDTTSDPAHPAGDPTQEVNDMGTNSDWKAKWADPAAVPASGAERVVHSDAVVPHPLESYSEQAGQDLPDMVAPAAATEDEREVLAPAVTRRLLMAAIATSAIVALLFVGKTVFGSSSSTSNPAPVVTAPAPTTVAPPSTARPVPTTVGAPAPAPAPAPTPNVVDFS